LSNQFASKSTDKFAGVEFDDGLGGLPVLRGCAAVIECRTIERLEVGDHILFLGAVEQYRYQGIEPLLFCQGAYLPGFANRSSE
jgi:flavin reductase (DIM6/NTAB) family NADH-FMN oxidoreductase RutF